MSIEIKTKKIIVQGEQYIKITGLKALKHSELPLIYVKNENHAYLSETGMRINTKSYNLHLGNEYAESSITSIIKELKTAGVLLQKINKELKEKNKDWHGEETFII